MNIIIRIKNIENRLTATEKIIAQYVVNNTDTARKLTSQQLGYKTNVSQSSIVKFCQKLGYKGYTDFKIAMNEIVPANKEKHFIHESIAIEDSNDTVIQKIAHGNKKTVDESIEINKLDKFMECVDVLESAKRILLAGIGASGMVAQDFCRKLLKLGKNVVFDQGSHVQMAASTTLSSDDLLFAISFSGESKEVIRATKMAKEKGAKIISLTNFTENSISNFADISLFVSSREYIFKSSAISSRIAQLTIVDILFVLMVHNNPEVYLKMIEENATIIRPLKANNS